MLGVLCDDEDGNKEMESRPTNGPGFVGGDLKSGSHKSSLDRAFYIGKAVVKGVQQSSMELDMDMGPSTNGSDDTTTTDEI